MKCIKIKLNSGQIFGKRASVPRNDCNDQRSLAHTQLLQSIPPAAAGLFGRGLQDAVETAFVMIQKPELNKQVPSIYSDTTLHNIHISWNCRAIWAILSVYSSDFNKETNFHVIANNSNSSLLQPRDCSKDCLHFDIPSKNLNPITVIHNLWLNRFRLFIDHKYNVIYIRYM